MLRTVPGDPSRDDLAPLRDKIPEDPWVLVIDVQFLIGAEPTDFPPQERPLFPVGSRSFTWSVHPFLLSLEPVMPPGSRSPEGL